MNVSAKTVETYRVCIKEKIELDNVTLQTREAAQWVIEDN